MPAHKRNDIAIKEFHRAISRLQRRRPGVNPKMIERWALRERGAEITEPTIRSVLNGTADPDKLKPLTLLVIRDFFDATDEELGIHAQRQIETLRRFFESTPDQGAAVSPPSVRHLRLA